ncbi:hypothetical protein PM082_019779 [Marasmius tenuissimus]|nr:hypothetical protein PM082_019779 [Marasmius tenuissimus]
MMEVRRGFQRVSANVLPRHRVGNYIPPIDHYTPAFCLVDKQHRRLSSTHNGTDHHSGHIPSSARHRPSVLASQTVNNFERHTYIAQDYIERFKVTQTLQELQADAGNMDIYDKLVATVDHMHKPSFPVQATSGIWEAKDDNTGKYTSVLIFLSHRYKSSDKVKESLPVEDQNAPHRLVAAVEDMKNRGIPMEFDGLPAQLIQRYVKTTHELAAYNNHTADYSKTRHGVAATKGTAKHTFPISSNTQWTPKPEDAVESVDYN